MANIILLGDSWHSVWYQSPFLSRAFRYNAPDSNNLHACRFNQMILRGLGHNVVDLSSPGQSNTSAIKRLQDYINNQPEFPNYIVFIESIPTRCLFDWLGEEAGMVERKENAADILRHMTWETYLKTKRVLREEAYERLSNAVHTVKDVKILVLGGCSKVDIDILDNYPNMRLITDSILSECNPNLNPDDLEIYFSNMHRFSDYMDNGDFVSDLYKRHTAIHNNKYFHAEKITVTWPDVGHPNAAAWLLILDRIQKFIEDDEASKN